MIVLAMLTGFNKIGSLERGRPRAKQFCVCLRMYLNVCVCVCVCVVHLTETVCFCPEKYFLCTHTVCVCASYTLQHV